MDNNGIIRMVEDKIESAVSDFDMESKMDGILVGFSGGADSSALLFYLNKRCRRKGTKLFAAHINHMIRNEEADRDEQFCRNICRELGIELYVEKVDVPKLAAESGESIEEAARNVRYRVYNDIASKNPAISFIATAHNAEDNMETVVFNMLRGTGIRGLSGIPPVRGFRIIRPLIYCTKSEIIGYCIANGVRYVTDSTNADTDYTRNYIRSELIPRFSRINPQPEIAISRLCSLLRDDDMFINKITHQFIDDHKIDTSAPRELLREQDMALLSRIIIHMYRLASEGNGYSAFRSLDCTHVKSVISLLHKGAPHSRITLPGKISAYITRDELSFLTEEQYSEMSSPKEPFLYKLEACDNIFEYPNMKITLSREYIEETDADKQNIYKLSIHKVIDFGKIRNTLFVRNRKPGDRYVLGGMSRNLKKLMCDHRIPIYERDTLPLLCDDSGIVWVPGFEPSDVCSVSAETKEFMYVRLILF